MTEKMNIVAFGECMLEMSRPQKNQKKFELNYAGDSYNFLYYLNRFQSDLNFQTHYITALGDDPFSDEMLAHWQSLNISIDLVTRIKGKLPGLYFVENDSFGERYMYYYRNDAAAKLCLDQNYYDMLINKLTQIDYFFLSSISIAILSAEGKQNLIQLLKLLKEKNTTIIYDINYRQKLWPDNKQAIDTIQTYLPFIDIAIPTFTDEQQLYGDETPQQTIARYLSFGDKKVIIKRGAEACIFATKNHSVEIPSIENINVIDTTAAGDSFNAGFLAGLLQSGDEISAIKSAHHLASQVIQYQGTLLPYERISPIY